MTKLLRPKISLIILLCLLIIIQFKRIDKSNPISPPSKDIFAILDASQEVQSLVKTACYDCHSHETKYPWYSNISPISWVLEHHIEDGRKHLNFSLWGDYNKKKASHKLEECFEEVAKEKMPLPAYTWTHDSAKLTEAQRAKLVAWFKKSKKLVDSSSEN